MTDKDTPPGKFSNPTSSPKALREQAEAIFLERASHTPEPAEALSPEKLKEMLHELHVYQIELEMQNEELQRAQHEMQSSQARYFDLYDLAPVGYLTVCEKGTIHEGNFAAAGLLGVSRQALIKQLFTRFILPADQDIYYQRRAALLDTRLPKTAELRMLGRKNKPFWAHLELSLAEDAAGEPEFRIVLSNINERKKAEAELRESETRNLALLRAIPDLIFVNSQDGEFLAFYAADPSLLYASPETDPFLHKRIWDVLPPAVADQFMQAYAQAVASETVQEVSYALMIGGEEKFFEARVARSSGDTLITISRDITERKRAEEGLRDANQKLRLHFEQTPMAVIEWDLDFRVTQWNPAAKTIFGYTRDEALGQHASFIVPPAVRPLVDEIFQALLKKVGGERSTNANVSKDGTPTLCEWYNTPLIDEYGTVAGFASVVMDITEQTEAVELLAWEKNALELIGGITPLHEMLDQLMLSLENQLPGALCSVLLLDEDGIHLRHGAAPSLPDVYNRAVEGLAIGPTVGSCGTAAFAKRQVIVEDIASDPLWAEYHEFAAQFNLRACWSTPIFSHGKVLGTFAIYYRESRRPAAHELELIERAVHVMRLAIKRRIAEEEIRKLNASLERRVEERTAELENANRELEAFTYSVSHDLRAPLRAVDGFSRMVIEDCAADLDADGQRMLGVIRSETQRMGRLIDDLLAFSRLGRLPIEPLPIDMHRLAQETFDELAAREPERKFQLDLRPLALTYGSEALIRQVWVNLLSNSLKFTRNREICEIEIGTQQGENGETVYYIKDNGAGFDMRHSGKLFGIFQRLHSQEEFSGTGVGLALVQRIVHRHGGQIWAESELDRGAAFYFTIANQKP